MDFNKIVRGGIAALMMAAVATFAAPALHAQDGYPSSRAVRIIVPSSPGGSLDITTRRVADVLAQKLGATVIVENRPGGDTLIGTNEVKSAAPDGYTLLTQANGIVGLPALKPDSGFDPMADVVPVGIMTRSPMIMVTGGEQPYDDAAGFIEAAKAASFTYAGSVGSPVHIAGAMFGKAAGLDMLLIPYKGNGEALPDVIAGRVNMIMDAFPSSASFLEGGQLKAIGVTSAERMPNLPDVPTFKEQGVDFSYVLWLGMFAPPGTSDDIVGKINSALAEALTDETLQKQLRDMGADPTPMNLEEFNAFYTEQSGESQALLKELDLTPKN